MSNSVQLNEKERKDMLKLRSEGYTYQQIAKKLDRHPHTIMYWCNEKHRKHQRTYMNDYNKNQRLNRISEIYTKLVGKSLKPYVNKGEEKNES